MKKIKYIVLILLLLLINILTSCSVSPTSTDSTGSTESTVSIDSNPKLEDLEYFCSMLEKKHKNLYANISKDEFEVEKKKIAEKTAEMSDSNFYYSLKHLLSMVGDAHTNLAFTDSQYKHLNALGFAVLKYSDGWHLVMLEKENEQYLGYKLLAINNMDINDVFNHSKKIMSFENETWAEMSFSNTINFREPLEYLGIIERDEPIVLKMEDQSGGTHSLEIKSMNEQEIMGANIVGVVQKVTPITAANGIYRAVQLDKDSFYIQYNSCQEAQDLPMKDFVSSVSDEVKKNNYKKVIIDLRYNSGGDSRIFEPMISELWKLQKEFDFKVYTIIGKSTFSSAIINAIDIKYRLNSTLVGTQTGGNVNGYGEIKSFNLKNMPITVWYSTKYFELIKGYDKDSLYPDIFVEQSFENYANGVDKEVEIILEIEDN